MEAVEKKASLSEGRFLFFFGLCLVAIVGYGAMLHSFREDDIMFFFYLLVPCLVIVGAFLLFSRFFPAIYCQRMGAPTSIQITGYDEQSATVSILFSQMTAAAWARFEVYCEIWLGKLQLTFVAGRRQQRWFDLEKKAYRVFASGNPSAGEEYEVRLEVPESWLPRSEPDPKESRTLTVWLFHPWFPPMKRILVASKDLSDHVSNGSPHTLQAEAVTSVPWAHSRGLIPSFALLLMLWLGPSLIIPTGWLGFASAMEKQTQRMGERLDLIETLLFEGKDSEASQVMNSPWEFALPQKWDFSIVYALRKRHEFLTMVLNVRAGKGTAEEIDRFRRENITPWNWLEVEFALRSGDIAGAFQGYHDQLAYYSPSIPRWVIPSLMTSLAYLESRGDKPEAAARAISLWEIVKEKKTGDDLKLCEPLESYCRTNAPVPESLEKSEGP